jgi:hypothetical protein
VNSNDVDQITLHIVVPRTLRRELKVEAARRGIPLRVLAIAALRAVLREGTERRTA